MAEQQQLKIVYENFYHLIKQHFLNDQKNVKQIQNEFEYFQNLMHKEQFNEQRIVTYLNIMKDMFVKEETMNHQINQPIQNNQYIKPNQNNIQQIYQPQIQQNDMSPTTSVVQDINDMIENMRYNNIELNLLFKIRKNYNFEQEQEDRTKCMLSEIQQIFRI